MSNDIENQDSTNLDEVIILEEESNDTPSEDAETLKETNRKLYARLKDAESKLKAKKESPVTEAKSEARATVPQSSNEHIERLELKVDGYADEEIAEIMKLGGKKVLENKIVRKAIDDLKAQRIAESAQVDSSSATSDFSRKYSQADLAKMSVKELEEILPRS